MFQIESRTDLKKKLYVPGPYFNENLAFLVNNLNGNNLIDKEYSLYLLCEIRYLVVRNKEALQQLLLLFPTIVLPEFKSNVMFLRMRANDIFIQYGRDKYDLEIIEKAAEMIYVCLSSDQSPIVRIKAASAFHNILTHPNAKGLVTPVLKDIL